MDNFIPTRKHRTNSELLIEEHRANRDKEEVEYITYSSTASSASSIYSSDDSSSSVDINERYRDRATQSIPNVLGIPERIKPENFGIITPDRIFRSSYPVQDNFKFLEAIGLRSIITLVDEIPDSYRIWMKKCNIRHITALVTPNKEHKRKRTDVRQIAHVLGLMMDPKNQPLLIHCNKGKHRSGCVAAAFRKCCGQPIETIIDEYVEFAGDKARVLDIAFIKAFDEREFLCSFRRDTLMDAMPLTGTFAETEPVIDPLSSSVVVSKVV